MPQRQDHGGGSGAAQRRHLKEIVDQLKVHRGPPRAAGALMPELMAHVTEGGVTHASGAASLIGDHAALGYILMGLLAFLLGVCVTVCLYRLRRRDERRRREDSDEL